MRSWQQTLAVLLKIVLVFVLLGLVVLFVMDKLAMPLYTRLGQEVVVPNLQGTPQDLAMRIADVHGYRFEVDTTLYDDHLPVGTVIEQIPPAGTVTKQGRVIRVVISGGEKLVPMPRLIGVSPQGAITTAASLGLVVPKDGMSYSYSNRYPKGVVLQQSIPQDSLLRKGTVISLVVSLGQEPTEFVVPKLLGQPLDRASQLLVEAGLTVGKINYRATRQYPEDTVVGQSIKSETSVPRGTAVDLLLAAIRVPEVASTAIQDTATLSRISEKEPITP